MILKSLPIIALILVSCQNAEEQIKNEKIIKQNSNVGNSKMEHYEKTIEDELFETMNRDNFITDTNRLKKIANYAYIDIRNTPFEDLNGRIKNPLDIDKHSMSKFGLLKNGIGYYFVKQDLKGKASDLDFTIEIWKIDTSNSEEIELMKHAWIEKYYPMPAYIVLRNDTLVFFNTRSSQFASILEKYVGLIKLK